MSSGLTDGEASGSAGAAGASSGMGGSAGDGPPDAGAGAAGDGPPAGGAGAGGSADASERCAEIEAEYASSFAQQLTCNPGGGEQCQDRIEAAAGCGCLVFIEPKDPFAIEHLTNVFIDYLDADCESSMCPGTCPSGARGTCGSDGLCTSEP
jgi:hypothetical protein